MHATPKQAIEIANKIEARAWDGIPTKKILQMIFTYLRKYKPEVKYQIDLREAIALLRPKPDFENFVQLLLKEFGYKVIPNQLIRGKCVEHEIDAIAIGKKKTIYVEIKHHLNPHTYTGLGVFLRAYATFEDLKEGFREKKHRYNFNKALVICNTKVSDHAKAYATCKKIEHIGWKYPVERGLEQMIEEKRLYPITYLKILDRRDAEKLGDLGIVTLKQLVKFKLEKLKEMTKIPKQKLRELKKKGKEILEARK
jgi:hypothetical protein